MSNPSIKTVVTCAAPNCGHVRGANNHWLLMELHNSHGPTISFGTWDDVDARQDGVISLCGDQCAVKMFQKWLSDQKANSTATPAQGGPQQ